MNGGFRADFPRLQILFVGLVALLLACFYSGKWTLVRELLLLGVIAAVAYQLKMVLPYTYLEKQVLHVRRDQLNVEQQIIAGVPMC